MPPITFSGIASGIDSSSLISTLLDQQRKARIDPLKSKISSFQDTNSALSKLSDLLKDLKTAADKFRTVNGTTLLKLATSSDETVSTATANSTAKNGSVNVSVTQLAKNATFSFDDRFSSSSSVVSSGINNAAAAANRTVSINIGTGNDTETTQLVLTNSTTLDQLAADFNSHSSKGVASVVNVGTTAAPSYALVVTSNNQGTQLGQVSVSVGSEITSGGVFSSSTLNQAQNSQFTVSGISGSISRSSNSVSDVISGVTLNFNKTGSATVTIGDDSAGSAALVQGFVDAYNDVVKFVQENDLVTQEGDGDNRKNIFGPLAGVSLDESILSSLRSSLGAASTSGRAINTTADFGITTQRDGTLAFDADKFGAALSSDSEGVRTVTQNLGESLAAVNGTIAQFTQFNGLISRDIALNTTQISTLNSSIADIEKSLSLQQETLNKRFSHLEAIVGSLTSQQATLSQLLR